MAGAESDVEVQSQSSRNSDSCKSGGGVSAKGFPSYGTADTECPEPAASAHGQEVNVPPADHGKAAWLFLAGCFWIEGLVWGESPCPTVSAVTMLLWCAIKG